LALVHLHRIPLRALDDKQTVKEHGAPDAERRRHGHRATQSHTCSGLRPLSNVATERQARPRMNARLESAKGQTRRKQRVKGDVPAFVRAAKRTQRSTSRAAGHPLLAGRTGAATGRWRAWLGSAMVNPPARAGSGASNPNREARGQPNTQPWQPGGTSASPDGQPPGATSDAPPGRHFADLPGFLGGWAASIVARPLRNHYSDGFKRRSGERFTEHPSGASRRTPVGRRFKTSRRRP
jgi:hypothetical protein